jgi:hypothetical protein
MSVLGSILGGHDGATREEILGELAEVIGAIAPPTAHMAVRRAGWRRGQMAPGVQTPDEGMHPLPLSPLQNNGGYVAAFPSITFQGQIQKPFRCERLLAVAVRVNTGGTAVGRILGQFFVGVDLQQAEIFGMDVELIGSPTAFGTRMTLHQAEPGVLIRIITSITLVPTPTDTVTLPGMLFFGRVVH